MRQNSDVRYELRAPSSDPEVPGGTQAFTASLASAVKWLANRPGNTVYDRARGRLLTRDILPATKELAP